MYKTSCRLLGLNRKSNYVARGLENRAAYDKFIELTGDIETNEMVVCRDGFGKLVSESEDSLTISLEPWQFEKTYSAVLDTEGEMGTARGQARLARWEPSLDEHQREERRSFEEFVNNFVCVPTCSFMLFVFDNRASIQSGQQEEQQSRLVIPPDQLVLVALPKQPCNSGVVDLMGKEQHF